MSLSKTAKCIHLINQDIPNVLCRLIGQFLGSDVPVDPGDMYRRRFHINDFIKYYTPYESRQVYNQDNSGRYIYWPGTVYVEYRVIAVTPCTFTCVFDKAIHVFFKSTECQSTLWWPLPPVAKIFISRVPLHEAKTRLFRGRTRDYIDNRQYNVLDKSSAEEIPDFSLSNIRYRVSEGGADLDKYRKLFYKTK